MEVKCLGLWKLTGKLARWLEFMWRENKRKNKQKEKGSLNKNIADD